MKPIGIVRVVVAIGALTFAVFAHERSAMSSDEQPQDSSSSVKNQSKSGCQADYSMNAPKDVAMNEDLKITFTAPANHDPKGWIGIFLAGDDPKKPPPVSRQNVSAEHQCSGSVTLKGVPTGEYDVYYFLDRTRQKMGPRSKLTAHTPV